MQCFSYFGTLVLFFLLSIESLVISTYHLALKAAPGKVLGLGIP